VQSSAQIGILFAEQLFTQLATSLEYFGHGGEQAEASSWWSARSGRQWAQPFFTLAAVRGRKDVLHG
jgi:hypothetical protein